MAFLRDSICEGQSRLLHSFIQVPGRLCIPDNGADEMLPRWQGNLAGVPGILHRGEEHVDRSDQTLLLDLLE